MVRKQARPPKEDKPVLNDSDIEEADIEALARSQLKPGETILGDKDAGQEDEIVKEQRGVLNKPMIFSKVSDIEYKVPEGCKRVPWIETLTISSQNEIPKGITAKDGVKLEGAFLSIAGEAVKEAYRRLRVMKVPCSRPPDFYAEMLRTDSTMYKVRAWASEEQRRIRIVEDRKKGQAAKKFSKQARATKLQARAKEKRDTLDDIAEWRAASKRDTKNKGEEDLEDILNRNASKKRGRDEEEDGKGKGKGKREGSKGKGKGKGKNKKREAANEKFGFGGKKSGTKRNDAKSANDMTESPWGRKVKGKGKGKGKGGGGGGAAGGNASKKKRKK